MNTYDLIVIGSGPGGYTAAVRAGGLGRKVVCVEQAATLGGTCLNIGCIPSKALLVSSEHYHFARERFAAHGLNVSGLTLDLAAMMRRKDGVVAQLNRGIEFLFKKNRVERLIGSGRLLAGNQVEVTNADGGKILLNGKNILLATGSVAAALPFLPFDGQRVVSSTEALSFSAVPNSLLVVGAGAIGLELGSVWSRLGAAVTVVEFLPRIAGGFDLEVAGGLQRSLERQGLKFFLNTQVTAAARDADGVTLTVTRDGKDCTVSAEKVLVAVGRKPNTAGLGLEHAGVQLDERGRVSVSDIGQTSAPNIYAVGDLTAGPMLAHKAEAEAAAVVDRLAGQPTRVNRNVIPSVIYTAPEAAAVGLTEQQARDQGLTVSVGKHNFMANGRALAADTRDGFVKLITDTVSGRLLGAHILGASAAELIAECALLMELNGTVSDLARVIHAHPTLAEVTKEAARNLP
ncbi:MAG: dihydrolipoyl dehydrogenase [Verrucomicrobiales bacterium]|jgi:dihydrolipoamide dehydrogenase|nr:dihydrolipoyl dehydrogenase [Verrucomicrobiales bacterium]